MKFVDLFCGIGGFHVALAWGDHKCVFACDSDEDVRKVYEKNFGIVPAGNIYDISADQIPEHDILCAGFPCKTFSLSGRRTGFEGSDGMLFFEVIRIIKHHKPKIVLLENVKNILLMQQGSILYTIYQELMNLGYKVEHYLLNSADYYIPQSRERAYFVAIRKDTDLVSIKPTSVGNSYRVVEDIVIDGLDITKLVPRSPNMEIRHPHEMFRVKAMILVGHTSRSRGQGTRIYSGKGLACTVTARHSGEYYLLNHQVRRLHIDETKKLMGFNRNHIVGPGYLKSKRQLGNAVIPNMVAELVENLTDWENVSNPHSYELNP